MIPFNIICALGITVNGQIIGDKNTSNDVGLYQSYFGKLGIVNTHLNVRLEITTEEIIIQNGLKQTVFKWLDEVVLRQPG